MVLLGIILGGKITVTSIGAALILFYLACLSAVAYALWGVLLKYNPVSRVSIFAFSTPVFGTLLSELLADFLPEKSNGVAPLNLVLALLLVALGIFLLNYQKQKKAI